jgi:uncharacterized protein
MLPKILLNYPLWASVIAVFVTQLTKVFWNYRVNGTLNWNWLIQTGSMPSGHTAAVTSLATAIGIQEGWGSPLFAITVILAFIVMYDATGIRRHAGIQARVLNRLMEDVAGLIREMRHLKDISPRETGTKLKEILGHQPIEVVTGASVGIFIAWLVHLAWS